MSQRLLQGKVVLITGASSGIGRSTALLLARQGARLALAGRRQQALEEVAREARRWAPAVALYPTHVEDANSVQALVRYTENELGPIDIAIASAGQYHRSHAASVSIGAIKASMDVNFYGTVHLVLAVLPGMLERGRGHIIAVSSVDGKKGLPLDAPYVASKFAVTGFFDSMRQDLRGSGVSITTVLPGRVDTPMIEDLAVPAISAKISSERAARAIFRAVRTRPPEVVVPYFSSKLLIVTAAFSPRLADWVIRLFRLEGTPLSRQSQDLQQA